MFRRNPEKDNSLFDTTDTANESNVSAEPAAAAAPATASATTSTAQYTPASASNSPIQNSGHPAAPLNRPAPEPRSSMAQTSGFRSATSALPGDRGRLPEVKNIAASAAASVDKTGKAGRRVLTVGVDILLKGEIATCDRLVIEGKVDATLNDVHTVEISETGSFKGSANIEDAEISGLFEGDLVVRNRLVIYSTGRVYGKISYGEVEIERGGELTGEIKTTTAASTATSTRHSRSKADDKVAA